LETTVVNHEVTSDTTIRITLKTDSIERSIEVNKIITTKKSPNTLSVEAPFELHKNKSGAFIISSSFQMKEKNNFYAIGDVNGLHLYPNQGYHQAFTLAQNFLEKLSKLDVYNFAFSLNVDPSISFYGMNKSQIEYSQMPYNEFMYEFKNDFKVKSKGELGRIKVFTNHKHEILGALLIGDELSELINVFVVAKQNNIKFHKLA
jgi:pyruvate/2-oxoglutarate dehydrogenase complex dihydrolipoamide dehydrogenase (E3) component